MRRPIIALLAIAGMALAGAAAAQTALTVYPEGPALISESRDLALRAGTQTLHLAGLPPRLLPETLWLDGADVELIAASYRDADSARAQVLRGLEGETLTLLRADGSGGDIRRGATLLAAEPLPLVRIGEWLEWIDAESPWRIALAQLSEAANLTGVLALQIKAARGGNQALDMTYQTPGLNWSADYLAKLDTDSGQLSLRAQAGLRNDTGVAWQDASVALIAGDVNRQNAGAPKAFLRTESAIAADGVAATSAFEYYRYDLPEPLTLARDEQKVVTLFSERDIRVAQTYRIEGGWRTRGDAEHVTAAIRLAWTNEYGAPLPAGTLRVYSQAEPPALLGEDRIANTPPGGDVVLTLGRAFDITAERLTTANKRDGKARELAREITLRNAKARAVEVQVIESLPGDWELLSASTKHRRLDANRAAWTLAVPAGGKAKLSYRVRYR